MTSPQITLTSLQKEMHPTHNWHFLNTSRNLLDAAGFWVDQSRCQDAALQLTPLECELANILQKAL